MTSEVLLHFLTEMRLHNVSIHRKFYDIQFTEECARKKKVKILESHRFTVFFSDKRTYILKNNDIYIIKLSKY